MRIPLNLLGICCADFVSAFRFSFCSRCTFRHCQAIKGFSPKPLTSFTMCVCIRLSVIFLNVSFYIEGKFCSLFGQLFDMFRILWHGWRKGKERKVPLVKFPIAIPFLIYVELVVEVDERAVFTISLSIV